MARIRVGLVGCCFVSELHMSAFRRVYGVDVEVVAVAARATMSLISPVVTKSRASIAASPTRGYLQEIQDFMECAASGRQPLSDLALAYETIKVNYAGYWAAEEGRRVVL